jgi:hypothetical protein
MVKESINLTMEAYMMDNFLKMKKMDKEFLNIILVIFMKEIM